MKYNTFKNKYYNYYLNNSIMDLHNEVLSISLSTLTIDETKIIKIQKWFRGYILR